MWKACQGVRDVTYEHHLESKTKVCIGRSVDPLPRGEAGKCSVPAVVWSSREASWEGWFEYHISPGQPFRALLLLHR